MAECSDTCECLFEVLFIGVSTRFGLRLLEKYFENLKTLPPLASACSAVQILVWGALTLFSRGHGPNRLLTSEIRESYFLYQLEPRAASGGRAVIQASETRVPPLGTPPGGTRVSRSSIFQGRCQCERH
jgi:hypothetical protein